MEDYYEMLSNKKVGESEVINVNNTIYEFIKISEYKYLVQHSIYVMEKWIELNGTMTTMEASIIYEKLHK